MASNVRIWRVSVRVEVGENRTDQQADKRAAMSVESAAALAPEWGRVEVRRGRGTPPTHPDPSGRVGFL